VSTTDRHHHNPSLDCTGEGGDVPLSPQWLFNKPAGSGGGGDAKAPPGVSVHMGEPPVRALPDPHRS